MRTAAIVTAAVLPAVAVAAALIAVAAWRDREAAADARARDDLATLQVAEMRRMGEQLSEARQEARAWKQRHAEDTKRLGEDLGTANTRLAAANQALIDSLAEQTKAQAAIADLSKQLADLAAKLQALEKAAQTDKR